MQVLTTNSSEAGRKLGRMEVQRWIATCSSMKTLNSRHHGVLRLVWNRSSSSSSWWWWCHFHSWHHDEEVQWQSSISVSRHFILCDFWHFVYVILLHFVFVVLVLVVFVVLLHFVFVVLLLCVFDYFTVLFVELFLCFCICITFALYF